jgi:hypothetical protein
MDAVERAGRLALNGVEEDAADEPGKIESALEGENW